MAFNRVVPIVTMLGALGAGFAHADTFEFHTKSNAIETYISFNLQSLQITDAAKLDTVMRLAQGDTSGIKPVSQLDTPVVEHFDLGDTQTEKLVHINTSGKVKLIEGGNISDIQIVTYTSEPNGQSRVVSQPIENGVLISRITQDHICAMTSAQGVVLGVQGTCSIIEIHVASGGKLKVYRDGSLLLKSKAAKVNAEEVAAAFEDSSTEGEKLLEMFLSQPGSSLNESQIAMISNSISGSSDKLKFIRKVSNGLASITSVNLIAIVEGLSGTSTKMDALRSLQNAITLDGESLIVIISDLSGSSSKIAALKLLSSRSTLSSSQVTRLIEDLSGTSAKLQGMRILSTRLLALEVTDAEQLLEGVSGSSDKLEAIRVMIPKISRKDRERFAGFAENEISGTSSKEEARRIILGQ